MYMVLFIFSSIERFEDVIAAWDEIGVRNVTVMASTGLGKLKNAYRDDLPLIPSLQDLLATPEITSRILMTVVRDESLIDKIVAQTEKTVGPMEDPDTGVIFVLPVARAYGIKSQTVD